MVYLITEEFWKEMHTEYLHRWSVRLHVFPNAARTKPHNHIPNYTTSHHLAIDRREDLEIQLWRNELL